MIYVIQAWQFIDGKVLFYRGLVNHHSISECSFDKSTESNVKIDNIDGNLSKSFLAHCLQTFYETLRRRPRWGEADKYFHCCVGTSSSLSHRQVCKKKSINEKLKYVENHDNLCPTDQPNIEINYQDLMTICFYSDILVYVDNLLFITQHHLVLLLNLLGLMKSPYLLVFSFYFQIVKIFKYLFVYSMEFTVDL